MISLVVLDLDGTVIGANGQVMACVWEAAERVTDAGIKIAVCTGRPGLGITMRVAERLGPNVPHIFQSGAHIAYASGQTFKACALKEAAARVLLGYARKRGYVLEVYTPSSLYVERKTSMSEAHAKMIGVTALVRDLEDVITNEPVVRAQWVVPLSQADEVIGLEVPGVEVSTATSPALSTAAFVSVTGKGVSKASATRDLAELLKVKLENVMAVGDSLGDVPMLDIVGHPMVMSNSAPELLERFDEVAGDVADCGVVVALEQALATVR